MPLPPGLKLPAGTLRYYGRLGKRVWGLMKEALGVLFIDSLLVVGTFLIALAATHRVDSSVVYALVAVGVLAAYALIICLVSAPVTLDNDAKIREANLVRARDAAVAEREATEKLHDLANHLDVAAGRLEALPEQLRIALKAMAGLSPHEEAWTQAFVRFTESMGAGAQQVRDLVEKLGEHERKDET